MSTKFTSEDGPGLLEKPLGLLLVDAQHWVSQFVQHSMKRRGYELNQAEFSFLANLDCGETHASSVARRMGISRQAVYRTTLKLKARGLLNLVDDTEKGNQKIIVMTDAGRQFVLAARASLAESETVLAQRIGKDRLTALITALSTPWGAPEEQ